MTTATIQQTLTDQTIASDMLITAKASIKDIATALSEAATPQVRTLLKQQFDMAVSSHEQLSNFMMSKGWYNPFNIKQQIQTDIQNANTVLNL
ncbi:spore coat protein [Paenibacillus sp. Soil787]|uniref:spore coat protein n=1 Tax=Paenibacillus sp. Soil787 TaxID=1736411 RepID=UPI0006FBF651|nr:spore coat protein [Paenibacillus sp. Soil787]KRF43491.1 spore gernimation protein GerQ [Paenibacillus sp. Soil787]